MNIYSKQNMYTIYISTLFLWRCKIFRSRPIGPPYNVPCWWQHNITSMLRVIQLPRQKWKKEKEKKKERKTRVEILIARAIDAQSNCSSLSGSFQDLHIIIKHINYSGISHFCLLYTRPVQVRKDSCSGPVGLLAPSHTSVESWQGFQSTHGSRIKQQIFVL